MQIEIMTSQHSFLGILVKSYNLKVLNYYILYIIDFKIL